MALNLPLEPLKSASSSMTPKIDTPQNSSTGELCVNEAQSSTGTSLSGKATSKTGLYKTAFTLFVGPDETVRIVHKELMCVRSAFVKDLVVQAEPVAERYQVRMKLRRMIDSIDPDDAESEENEVRSTILAVLSSKEPRLNSQLRRAVAEAMLDHVIKNKDRVASMFGSDLQQSVFNRHVRDTLNGAKPFQVAAVFEAVSKIVHSTIKALEASKQPNIAAALNKMYLPSTDVDITDAIIHYVYTDDIACGNDSSVDVLTVCKMYDLASTLKLFQLANALIGRLATRSNEAFNTSSIEIIMNFATSSPMRLKALEKIRRLIVDVLIDRASGAHEKFEEAELAGLVKLLDPQSTTKFAIGMLKQSQETSSSKTVLETNLREEAHSVHAGVSVAVWLDPVDGLSVDQWISSPRFCQLYHLHAPQTDCFTDPVVANPAVKADSAPEPKMEEQKPLDEADEEPKFKKLAMQSTEKVQKSAPPNAMVDHKDETVFSDDTGSDESSDMQETREVETAKDHGSTT